MKTIWIHDNKVSDFIGGAELTDSYWITRGRMEGVNVVEISKGDEFVSGDNYIVSNFALINQQWLRELQGKKYTIVIHGKPIETNIKDFYKNAQMIVYMSPDHMKVNEGLNPSSVWCAPYINHELFTNQNKRRIRSKYLYIGNIDYGKGIKETIEFADNTPIDFYGNGRFDTLQFIGDQHCGSLEPHEVPDTMNSYETFIWYLPRFGSYGRTLVEAMLCGMKLKINKENFGLFSYDWDFESRDSIIENLEANLVYFWKLIK